MNKVDVCNNGAMHTHLFLRYRIKKLEIAGILSMLLNKTQSKQSLFT